MLRLLWNDFTFGLQIWFTFVDFDFKQTSDRLCEFNGFKICKWMRK